MIYLWLCDRRRFVDFITNRTPPSEVDVRSADTIEGVSLHGDDILLVWQESPVGIFTLPRAVIVAEESMSDFLAWVSTYFRHIRPFTAHCRVITPSLAQLFTSPISSFSIPDVGSADIGLILAEGIAYSVGRADLNRLPLSAFARTLSFVFAESAKRFERMYSDNGKVIEQIKNGWLSARELTNQASQDLSPSDISDVWEAVLNAIAGVSNYQANTKAEQFLIEALQGVKENGHVPSESWMKLSDRFQKVETAIEAMEGPRENRVKAVEMALQELSHGSPSTRRERAFIAGYLTSRIQPGSLDHFSLLSPAITEIRESFLWYGACSGLTPETAVDNYGNGLGWLIKRELGRPSHWLDQPNCDIALSEMTNLFRNREGANLSLRTFTTDVLKVEIFPLVSTNVKWSWHSESQISNKKTTPERQMGLFEENVNLRQDVTELLSEIQKSSKSLAAIRKIVELKFSEKIPKKPKPKRRK